VRHFVHYTNVKNYDSIYRYYEKNNKGDYNMSKVKQWAEDTAEKSVDNILKFFKNGTIDLNETKKSILNVENVNMLGINSENVDEVIQENA
jgi:hypothetical protein